VFTFHWNGKSDGVKHHTGWTDVLTITVHEVTDDTMTHSTAVDTQLMGTTYRHRQTDIDRQTDRQTQRHIERYTQTDRQTEHSSGHAADGYDLQTQTDRQTDR